MLAEGRPFHLSDEPRIRQRTAVAMLPIRALSLCSPFLLMTMMVIRVSPSSLWEKSCPGECACTVEPWPYIQLDAKVMRCSNRSLDCLPRNLTTETEVLLLDHNTLGGSCELSLRDLRYLQSLRFCDFSCNRIRTIQANGVGLVQVRYLNLSHNMIHSLPVEALADFAGLEYLNLENNCIKSLNTTVFALPNLQYLNLRRNRIFTLTSSFNAPQLRTLVLSHNLLTRLLDGAFFRTTKLQSLDLSYNRLSKIEDQAFDGLHWLAELNLEANALRAVPTTPLQAVPAIGRLVMDRNLFRHLGPAAFLGVNVSHVSLCHLDELTVVQERTFANMPYLATVDLCSNKRLTSVAPKTFVALPRLQSLDLRNNNLYVIEESFRSEGGEADHSGGGCSLEVTGDPAGAGLMVADAPILPVPLTLRLNGNPLICDCNLKWVQDILTRQYTHNVTVPDGGSVKCLDRQQDVATSLLDQDDLPSQCAPFVLPLFLPVAKETVASNVSFLCRGVGIPPPEVRWVLPDGRMLANDRCEERACVAADVLTIRYLHEQDSGVYECRAKNDLGEFKRNLHLEVDNINILLFALTVTSTIVTLAWNATGLPPMEYQLQYFVAESRTASSAPIKELSFTTRDGSHTAVELRTKVHSYTITGLTPGETYTFWLCIKRADYAIRVSTLDITTRDDDFLLMLGIQRNYASVILIGAAVGIIFLGCATLCCVKICRWVRQEHVEMVASECGSSRCFVKSDSCNSDVAFMTYINVDDDTILVENEDESPQ